eukprot:6097582-Alexandrium_andersonii.AAC.1
MALCLGRHCCSFGCWHTRLRSLVHLGSVDMVHPRWRGRAALTLIAWPCPSCCTTSGSGLSTCYQSRSGGSFGAQLLSLIHISEPTRLALI